MSTQTGDSRSFSPRRTEKLWNASIYFQHLFQKEFCIKIPPPEGNVHHYSPFLLLRILLVDSFVRPLVPVLTLVNLPLSQSFRQFILVFHWHYMDWGNVSTEMYRSLLSALWMQQAIVPETTVYILDCNLSVSPLLQNVENHR